MPKKALENLTESMFYVLMAFDHSAMCGIDVAAFVEARSQKSVILGPATLYTILGKFEKEQYIEEIEVDGRKRTYRLTDRGRNAYQAEIARLKRCLTDAERNVSDKEVNHESSFSSSQAMPAPMPCL